MALVPHKITALEESNDPNVNTLNTVAGAVVSLYDTNGSVVTLFDDAAGTNGSTAKTTDAQGVVVVYVNPGEYDEEINNGTRRRVNVGGIEDVFSGVSLVFDDANAVVKNDLMPLAVASGIKSSLAVYHSGMASSYDFVSLREALLFKKSVNGEILSHSMNSVVLDDSIDLSYGENLIETSAREFSQFGLMPRGFVAPSSVLAEKFKPQLRQSYDFAFIRSVGAGAGDTAINFYDSDRYNLTRVALTDSSGNEVITLDQAKAYVDVAKSKKGYLCFYAHTLPTYLSSLINYIKSNFKFINPSEWVSKAFSLGSDVYAKKTKNLIENSSFLKLKETDANPFDWSFSPGTLVSPTLNYNVNGEGNTLDLISSNNLAGNSATLTQVYDIKGLSQLTPLAFSVYCSSVLATNTEVQLSIYAKNSTDTTITSVSEVFTISANRQRLELQQGFIPDVNVDYFLIEIKILSKGLGTVRALIDSPQLETSGYATAYSGTGIKKSYYSVMRRVTGLTVSSNADVDLIFDGNLEGNNLAYNPTSGEFISNDGRTYELSVNVGLSGMVSGDRMQLQLKINNSVVRKIDNYCLDGENISQAIFTVRGDGRAYKISIRHNSASPRSLTTFSNATLTICSKS